MERARLDIAFRSDSILSLAEAKDMEVAAHGQDGITYFMLKHVLVKMVVHFKNYIFQEYGKPVYSYSTNPDRRFSSSTSQHF